MSLITRCPSCGTMFKVVPDQLRISEGWVRCGHCAEIFDGPANFHDPNAAPPPPEPVPDPQSAPHDEAPYEPPVQPPFQPQYEPQQYEPQNSFNAPAYDHGGSPSIEPVAAPEVIDITLGSDLPAAEVQEVPAPMAFADAEQQPAPVAVTPEPPPEPEQEPGEVAEPAAAAGTPSFVKLADRKAFWRRPAVRGALALVMLLLAVALGLQAAYHERDRVATLWPAARPLLQQMCVVAGCEVGALRKIESITIDGSSFTRLRADAYRLSIILKNNGSIDLAMPSVELTLTDTQDQAVIRRVLSPADMGAGTTLAAGAEWSGAVPIAVTAAGGAARVAGYRVLAFYP